MEHLRHLPLKKAHNVRDLGGYPAADGKYTEWNLLYRGDSLAELLPEDWQLLESRGIRTIIDLRSGQEQQANVIRVPETMEYYHLSLMRQVDEMDMKISGGQENEKQVFTAEAVARMIKSTCLDYGEALQTNIRRCAEVLQTILNRLPYGSVLFLCTAGKDRTGITAALVLYLCGVPHEDIVADYSLSTVYNQLGINPLMEAQLAKLAAMFPDQELMKKSLQSFPETMEKLLQVMEEVHIEELLERNGFTLEEQERLRHFMLRDCAG